MLLLSYPLLLASLADCPYNYSSEWVTRQHEKAVSSKCAAPFACDDSIVEDRCGCLLLVVTYRYLPSLTSSAAQPQILGDGMPR